MSEFLGVVADAVNHWTKEKHKSVSHHVLPWKLKRSYWLLVVYLLDVDIILQSFFFKVWLYNLL